MKRFLPVLTLALALLGAADARAAHPLLAPTSACPSSAPARTQVLCLTNWARARSDLAPLRADGSLHMTAQAKANDMLFCQQFSHTACGRPFDFWLRNAAPPLNGYAENLYRGSGALASARSAVDGWLNSPDHLRAIRTGSYRRLGVGVALGSFQGRGNGLWVQHFAT